jgi:hypothetical protein
MTPAITNTGRRAIPIPEDHVAKANSDDGNFRKLLSSHGKGALPVGIFGRAKVTTVNICYWHFSDIPIAPTNARCWG